MKKIIIELNINNCLCVRNIYLRYVKAINYRFGGYNKFYYLEIPCFFLLYELYHICIIIIFI